MSAPEDHFAPEDMPGYRRPDAFSKEEAERYNIVFYCLPQDLDLKQIDPLMRPIVSRINSSGWVWTAECCQGHPDYARSGDAGWDHNVRPFVRLVCGKHSIGKMMGLLTEAMRLPDITEGEPADMRIGTVCGFETYVWPRDLGPWEQVNIYVKCHNVQGRNQGLEALQNFADSLTVST